jgi:hypothetical protein
MTPTMQRLHITVMAIQRAPDHATTATPAYAALRDHAHLFAGVERTNVRGSTRTRSLDRYVEFGKAS